MNRSEAMKVITKEKQMTERATYEGSVEPWLTLDGKSYSREECFAAYTKADAGEVLTQEEARVVGGWLVHPLVTSRGLAPFSIAHLLLRRQQASPQATDEATDPQEGNK